MHRMESRLVKFAILFLVTVSCSLWYFWPKTKLIISCNLVNREKSSSLDLKKLKPLEPAQFNKHSDFKCANATLANLSFPMCFYEPNIDVYISKNILSGRYFEADVVTKFMKFLKEHQDVTFVDLGANIGTYSLPLAHSGSHVVAVEPNRDTVRRLAKSVYLGKKEHTIDVLNYALSDKESTQYLQFSKSNRGDTYLVGNSSCPDCLSTEVTILNNIIPIIRNKKVLMKVDTQGAEIKIFTWPSAGKFFSENDVIMIQLEWHFYPEVYGKTEEKRRMVDRFLEFFYQRGYEVYDPRTEKKLGPDWTKWTVDVMFKKSDLPRDCLFYRKQSN